MPSPVVLVLDDDSTVVALLREIIDEEFELVDADDGAVALRRLVELQPEVVFSDIYMPEMNGLDFLEQARQAAPDIPVILMTGYKKIGSLERAIGLGAFEFIDKPFDVSRVTSTFQRAVRHRRQLRRRHQIEALAREINRVGDLDDLLGHLSAELSSLVGVRMFSLFLFDPDRKMLTLAVTNHVPAEEVTELALADLDGPMRRAVNDRLPAFIRSEEKANWTRNGGTGIRYLDDTSATLPLLVRDKLIGVLNLNDKLAGPSEFDDDDIAFLSIAAEHIASAVAVRLETARLGRALAELRDTQQRLVQSEKLAALTKLVAGIAHELKNPLTSLHLCTVNLDNLYRDQGIVHDDSPEREFIQSLHQDIDRLQEKVERFLTFARPDNVDRERSSPAELVEMAVAQVSERLRASGIALEVREGDGIPDVTVDRAGFVEAVVNLLVNAIEAISEPVEGRIVLTISSEERNMRLKVTDNGSGIPTAAVGKIFDIFFTTKPKGSGIGLSQVHLFCSIHGGHLSFDSPAGETHFAMVLPAERSP